MLSLEVSHLAGTQALQDTVNRKNITSFFLALPANYIFNNKPISKGRLLGWDYGNSYWFTLNSGFVEWDRSDKLINKIALLSINFREVDYT